MKHRAMTEEWQHQIPRLVSAYLKWKHTQADQSVDIECSQGYFEVTVVDIKRKLLFATSPSALISPHTIGRTTKVHIPQAHEELANVALINAGLLGSAPVNPSVAITLDCLELYHQIRRRQATFSLQSMCKILCIIHNVSYFVIPGIILTHSI
jgi:hypothetical protein